MRRLIICLSFALVVLLGLVATMGRSTNAQEAFATPGPDEFELAPGQIGRELASGRFEEPPAGPLHMGLLRVTNDPGSVSRGGGPDDPTGALILVESGAVTVRLEEPATITRTTGPEEVPANTDFTLGPGESFVWEPFVVGEIRNDGQEPAVTFAAFLAPADWVFEESTP
ncbi:MAG: hypothetical protein K0S14_3309, partial [Thermomicrobiales bacterium]|nr:hypothetical protein [Thermomicrobiales bacterium]